MPTFYKFALEIETSLGKRLLKTISETRNASNVIMYIWFLF